MKKVLIPILSKHWLLILLTLFIANVGLLTAIRLRTKAATCFTNATIASDSRCLYILSGKVYNKGSRSSPHQGHPCGQDVTSIIPSFHIAGMTSYLDPNYVGDMCTSPSPTPIPSPTIQPTHRTCMNLACTTVVGIGTNQCNIDGDCIPTPTPRLTNINVQSSITNYVSGYTVTISQQKSTATTPTACSAATQVAVVGAITNFQSTCANLSDGTYTFTTVVNDTASQIAGQVSSPQVTVPLTSGNLYIQPALILSLPTATPPMSLWSRSDIVVNSKVDIFDYNAMVSDFGCPSRLSPACAANWNIADIIQNGKVDIFDYNAMVSDFGCPSRTSPVCT